MAFMKPEEWQLYIDVMNEWQEDAFQQNITWVKFITYLNKFNEDGPALTENIQLKGLIQYNYFRAWPVTQSTTTGELDKESCLLYLNVKVLKDLGYIINESTFNFDPAMDRFIIDGLVYKSTGESQAAQAHDKTLFYFMVLKREETNTGSNRNG